MAYGGIQLPAWTSTARAAESQQQPAGFADLVARVKPAVISVRVRVDQSSTIRIWDGTMKPFRPSCRGTRSKSSSVSTDRPERPKRPASDHHRCRIGVLHFADGYAVTNNHVVDHAKSVQVTTDDGTTYTARVIGTDPKTDIALIKVDGKSDFAYVKYEDSAPRVGDWVVAVGTPLASAVR